MESGNPSASSSQIAGSAGMCHHTWQNLVLNFGDRLITCRTSRIISLLGDWEPYPRDNRNHAEKNTRTIRKLKILQQAGCLWLTPVILATQEAEIRRITVRNQPGQIVRETLSQKTLHKKLGWWRWLKVKVLSSSLSSTKKKKKNY
jgi:hypothetical protein